MNIFSFLKAPPALEEIKDENVVKTKYKYWRWRIFYGMYIGYVFYYFSRKALTFCATNLSLDLGFTKSEIGILFSILAFSYGLSKFLIGFLSDRSNARYFMGLGLIITGLLNICFGLSSSFTVFVILWGLNGYFQGCGWPPSARLLIHWYSQKERGTWWGFWNTSHSVGGSLIPLIVGVCIYLGGNVLGTQGWRLGMIVPGVLSIIGGIFVINRLRDTPASLGLPPVETFKNDPILEDSSQEKGMTVKEMLLKYVFKNKIIWALSAAYFFLYVIRMSVSDWSPMYLSEHKGYAPLTASSCIFWFEIGGIFGSLVAGWTSDKIFGGKRGPVNLLFTIGIIGAVASLWFVKISHPAVDSALQFVVGFFIFGPQMLIGMVAAEIVGKRASGTANGFVNFMAYIGATVAGFPMGYICEKFGWGAFIFTIGVCGILSAVLLIPLLKVGGSAQKAPEPLPDPSVEFSE